MAGAISTFLDQIRGPSSDRYRLVAVLSGHDGPINALAFNAPGTLLASGGDDEEVRIWDLGRNALLQVLADENRRWGQITCAKFVMLEGPTTATDWLYIGTGRGFFLAYRRPRKASFVEHFSKRIFTPGDSVEAFDVDETHRRIVLSSHNGKVKLCSLDDENVIELWCTELLDVIPRSVRFIDSGRLIFIYGLETGILLLPTPVGDVSVCPSTGAVAIDNMKNGFDLYFANRVSVIRTFPIECVKKFVKKSAFGEGGKVLVCGSDHGAVYIYPMSSATTPLQILRHGPRSHMIQTVEAVTAQDDHIIASGASTGRYAINIWKKRVRNKKGQPGQSDTVSLTNVIFIFLLAYLTIDKWFPLVEKHYISVKTYALGDVPSPMETMMSKQSEIRQSDGLSMELDEATMQRLVDTDEFLGIHQFLRGEVDDRSHDEDGL